MRSTNTAALLFAVAGTQLSYVPLVLATDHRRHRQRLRAGEPGVGDDDHHARASSLPACAVALSLATADEWWLWAAIPANLGAERPALPWRVAALKRGTAPLSHEAHVKLHTELAASVSHCCVLAGWANFG